jgi:hypothetical protein
MRDIVRAHELGVYPLDCRPARSRSDMSSFSQRDRHAAAIFGIQPSDTIKTVGHQRSEPSVSLRHGSLPKRHKGYRKFRIIDINHENSNRLNVLLNILRVMRSTIVIPK